MNSLPQDLVRPNLPLRKPSSNPVGGPGALGLAGGPGDSTLMTCMDNSSLIGSVLYAMNINLCNYCSKQAGLRCARCKKTFYCCAGCQAEDWKAHRHMCKSSCPEPARQALNQEAVGVERKSNKMNTHQNLSEKLKATPASSQAGTRFSLPEPKVNPSQASPHQRVYLVDLNNNKVSKGTEMQVSVVVAHSPGRFFVHTRSSELLESLQSLSMELQNIYSRLSNTRHLPNLGEVCAVQFSLDLNWYRGLIQSVAVDQKVASVLYIDFGNEEDVPVDRIRPLAANIKPIAPCAIECCVAGVVPVTGIWPVECCMAVRGLLVGEMVTVSVVDVLQSARVHAVDIMMSSLGKQLSVFLVDQGYARVEPAAVKHIEKDISLLLSTSLANFRRLSIGKDDNTELSPPESLTHSLGDSFRALVTLLRSPHDMICQKVDNASVIQELQMRLQDHCCQIPARQSFRPAPGTVCCSQFSEDNQWYRAKVLAYSSEERVCVGYIDFGNAEDVELGHLRPLNASLRELPMQAIPCALAGLQPVYSPAGHSLAVWSKECVLTLQQRVSNRILHVRILGEREGVALVAMTDETSDPRADVAELLITGGYAVSAPGGSELAGAETTTSGADAEAASQQRCEPLVWSSIKLPCDSQKVAMMLCSADSPGEFYCYSSLEVCQKLVELDTELKKYCEAESPPFRPKVGDPCCAMFPDDRRWYRATVLDLLEDKAVVSFVDYGNTVRVENGHLRAVTPGLLSPPVQAVRCWLAGVEPVGPAWSSEARLWFQTLVGQQLSARVIQATEHGYGVELESGGRNIAAVLISKQMARVTRGTVPPAAHTPARSPTEEPETPKGSGQRPALLQTSSPTGTSPTCSPGGKITMATQSAALFPVDWKTEELPRRTFQPRVAAVTDPSLFYLLSPIQVDPEKLQQVMMELAVYCSTNQAAYASTPLHIKPEVGATCCAQFSGDNNWYRAVVLELRPSEANVVFCDYGNCEPVPWSRILPIPAQLLQLPFQITRCALIGKENFPPVWPIELLRWFESLLSKCALATVQGFNGVSNLLTISLSEMGGATLNNILVGQLHRALNPQLRVGTTLPGAAPLAAAPVDLPRQNSDAVGCDVLQSLASMARRPLAEAAGSALSVLEDAQSIAAPSGPTSSASTSYGSQKCCCYCGSENKGR